MNGFEIKLNPILEEKNMSLHELSEKTGIRLKRLKCIAENNISRFVINEFDILCNVLEVTLNDLIEHKKNV